MGIMKELLESQKVYIDKDLWYIPNFLTKKENMVLKEYCDEPTGWYITSRSTSIRNKFIDVKYRVYPEGTVCPSRGIDLSLSGIFPTDDDEIYKNPLFWDDGGLLDRLNMVLPKTLIKNLTLQSFWPLDDSDHYGAYKWHYEKGEDPTLNDKNMTGSWSLYLNDEFEGGSLEFLYKPYILQPKSGMLTNIPITKDFTHRVNPITSGIRHTLYGSCFANPNDRNVSTGDSC
jgi:hypothetical protein